MRTTLWLSILMVLGVGPAAVAGPQVPPVPDGQLPVAGTCAPIEAASLTWVTVGEGNPPAQPIAYRLNDDATDVRADAVRAHLERSAQEAVAAGFSHEVWITVRRDRPWARVVELCQLCEQTGVHRVGLTVQAESGDGTRGFPLFLPPPTSTTGASGTTARLLEVRLVRPVKNPFHSRAPVASSADRLYEAARRAVEHFGPIVASASIRWDVPVQDAVRAIDYLYRAGCSAVRLPYLVMVPPNPEPIVEMWVKDGGRDRVLESTPLGTEIPPVRPRDTPWPADGAALPGAFALTLEPIPSRDAPSPEAAARLEPLPSWAAGGHEVPPATQRSVEGTLRKWGETLGMYLKMALQPGPVNLPESLLVRRLRQGLGAQDFFSDSRAALPAPDDVVVSTARMQAFLFRGATAVGQVDVTLGFADNGVGLIFANWVAGEFPEGLNLPPRETDPYAPGIPGRFRIWLEAILATARLKGPAALTLTTEADVLAQLPAVAHPGVRGALARRRAGIENVASWLRATPFDRVFVAMTEGSAAVHKGGRIVGVLRFDLAPEQGDMSLSSLTPRVAPR